MLLLIAVGLIVCWLWWNQRHPAGYPALDFTPPLHISHRGGALLGPEQTMPQLSRAVEEFRTDVLEVDVRATADGVPVLLHDSDVSRTTDGRGEVNEMGFNEVLRLDAGYRFSPDGGKSYPYRGRGVQVATLAEALDGFPNVLFHIDVKQAEPPIADAVLAMIRRRNLESRVFIGSMNRAVSRYLRKAAPDMAKWPEENSLRMLFRLFRLRLHWLYHFRHEIVSIVAHTRSGREVVTREFVHAIHRRGRKVFAFIVDDERSQRELLEAGVDGIITDRPDRLRRVLDEWVRR